MAKSTAAKNVKKEVAKPAPVKAKAPAPKAKAPAKAIEAVKPAAAASASKVVAKPAVKSSKLISAQERYHMIDEAAYYRAEKSGFQVDPHANWVAAEKEIDELLSKQDIKVG